MANMIGLMLKVKLIRSLGSLYKVEVQVKEGTHNKETEINKQLKDKERVYAAMENERVLRMVHKGI